METSQQVVDLLRDGFHAALRFGRGPGRGRIRTAIRCAAAAHRAGIPETARALPDHTPETLAGQPAGERDVWQHWFNSAGLRIPVNPVATFNDAGMMLQAAEQGLGIALGRELLAADALCAGRLVQLSTVRVQYEQAQTYHLVYRPSLRDWPPLVALKQWLRDELELSRKSLVTYQPEDCAEGENKIGGRQAPLRNQDNALGQAQPRARPVRREARSCARARETRRTPPRRRQDMKLARHHASRR